MRKVFGVVIVAWAAFTTGLLIWWNPPPGVEFASALALAGVELAAAWICWRTGRSSGRQNAWRAISVAMALAATSWIAQAATVWGGRSAPPAFEPASLGVVLAYGVFGWAILSFAQGAGRRQLRRHALLDGTIIACSLAIIAWVLIDHAAPGISSRMGLHSLYELALPIGDILILTLVVLAMGRAPDSGSRPLQLIALSAMNLVLVDSALWFLVQTGRLQSYAPLQGFWMASGLLIAGAAVLARREPIRLSASRQVNRPRELSFTYIPVGASVVVGLSDIIVHRALEVVPFICGTIMFLMLLVRQFVGLRENIQLADQLRASAVAASEGARVAHDQQRRHQAILNSLGDAVLLLDSRGCVQSSDGAVQRMFGRTAADLFGRNAAELIEAPMGDWTSAALAAQPFVSSITTQGLRGDGSRFDAEVTFPPGPDSGPRPAGQVLVVRDITDRTRAEDERRRRDQQEVEVHRLQEINRFKSNFLNMAAHELGTPLTPIKIQLHLLQNELDQDPEARHHAHAILGRNVDRLSLLVRDLLDAARIQSSQLRMQPQPVQVRRLITEIAESYQTVAARANIQFDVRVQDDVLITCDPQRISQVVTNLLNNAIKFTPGGGTVRLDSHAYADEVLVAVHDTGRGLRAEEMPRLFRPFSQLDSAAREGTGLGLYLSKGIVEASGGRIWCESAGEGKGSSFCFTLPTRATTTVPSPSVEPLLDEGLSSGAVPLASSANKP